LRTGEADLRF